MKKKIPGILFGLMFLIGFGILVYPTVADQWNTYRQNRLISSYEDTVEEMEPEDFTREWEAARSFNATIPQNNIYGDVFGEDGKEAENTAYWQVLNIAGDGVMGYLSIPKIDVKLSIYHGTSDEVLQTGIGHLDGTAFRSEGRAPTACWRPTGDCQVQGSLLTWISYRREINFTSMCWMKFWHTRWTRSWTW